MIGLFLSAALASSPVNTMTKDGVVTKGPMPRQGELIFRKAGCINCHAPLPRVCRMKSSAAIIAAHDREVIRDVLDLDQIELRQLYRYIGETP
jgi:hypothetical protein